MKGEEIMPNQEQPAVRTFVCMAVSRIALLWL